MAGGYDGPGRYRHYKGGEYEVLGLAIREETKQFGPSGWTQEVVYRPLTPGSMLDTGNEEFWTRTRQAFDAPVLLPRLGTAARFWRIG